MRFTVLGSEGFVGVALVKSLTAAGHEVLCGTRSQTFLRETSSLGHVIYCIGVTADFRDKYFETVYTHVSLLNEYIHKTQYESFTYFSSARVYKYAESTHEDARIAILPRNPDEIYNISKLMGESICLANDNPKIRVLRPSNIIDSQGGSYNFLDMLIQSSLSDRRIHFLSGLGSAKDYVSLDELVAATMNIALSGQKRLYNLASGVNLSNRMIGDIISEVSSFPVSVEADAEDFSFPVIDIERFSREFSPPVIDIKQEIRDLVRFYMRTL